MTTTGHRHLIRTAWIAGSVINLAVATSIVFVFKTGPTIVTLTATHGVHKGDALALVPGLGALWCATRASHR